MSKTWHRVCTLEELDVKDVVEFEHEGHAYAVYSASSGYYATDGKCSHGDEYLADGFVVDDIIECWSHRGRFHIPTGRALTMPACVHLKTYPVKTEGGDIYISL